MFILCLIVMRAMKIKEVKKGLGGCQEWAMRVHFNWIVRGKLPWHLVKDLKEELE